MDAEELDLALVGAMRVKVLLPRQELCQTQGGSFDPSQSKGPAVCWRTPRCSVDGATHQQGSYSEQECRRGGHWLQVKLRPPPEWGQGQARPADDLEGVEPGGLIEIVNGVFGLSTSPRLW